MLELLHLAMQTDRPEQAQDLLTRFRDRFSFRYALGGRIRLGPNHTMLEFEQIVNAGYPDEWLRLYCHRGLAERDPILKTTLRAPRAYHWKAICQSLSSEQERDFITAARRFGLHDGITIGSADEAHRLVAFCSFATDRDLDADRLVPLVEYLGSYILQALRRIAPPIAPAIHRSIQNLSSRELTVLLWMTTGKTNREIGTMLGVSERTIRFHIENIFAKLDVTSRSQAVATVIELNLLDHEGRPPAMPQNSRETHLASDRDMS
ncbi:MAG: autoinducer binding domain-containing protein [Nitrospira sp.]